MFYQNLKAKTFYKRFYNKQKIFYIMFDRNLHAKKHIKMEKNRKYFTSKQTKYKLHFEFLKRIINGEIMT